MTNDHLRLDDRHSLPPPHAPGRNGRLLRVLVVGDDEGSAGSLALSLSRYGYEVHLARDGPTALQAAQADEPDVVFLDLGPPGLDGYQVAMHLREQAGLKKPFLIAVTDSGLARQWPGASHTGIDLFCLKPADPQRLHQLLERFRTILGEVE
jgi:CheY-like chemotaxis protein